ncbi:uncharacterized protein [Ptychodera flava]|uniref:uncharacterized protein n=1 Tax=Ptychodera flava TaxID=63121 RepID=UPI003969FA02
MAEHTCHIRKWLWLPFLLTFVLTAMAYLLQQSFTMSDAKRIQELKSGLQTKETQAEQKSYNGTESKAPSNFTLSDNKKSSNQRRKSVFDRNNSSMATIKGKNLWMKILSAGTSPRQVSFEINHVTGASRKQGNYTGLLKPKDHFVVPNIAHFIWFTCHPFKFENLVSMLSVHRIMKADKIFFHTDCEPTGEWWDEAVELIQTLYVIRRTPPTAVFDNVLNPEWPEHAADVARLQILIEHGGVYFDTDIFVLAPLEPLRYYDYVVGRPAENILNNGVILAKKSSKFLKLYYESYKDYISDCWACTSVHNQHDQAMNHLDLLHIEPDSMIQPPYTEWEKLFLEKYDWRSEHFTIHVWFREFYEGGYLDFEFTRENIKNLNTTVGEMCRYIYYGSPDIMV